ncbi:hypothetical protein [Kribbella sp. NPDC051137]|uniref:hypothetical protein n=1 Tax=Kribbella sp. NPDC051137 TaxID=3155045 RepID=UPI002F8E2CA3
MKPFAVQAGEGAKHPTLTTGWALVKADTAATNGALTVMELLIPRPKAGKLSRPVDPEELAALGHACWIELAGPPLEVSDPLPR